MKIVKHGSASGLAKLKAGALRTGQAVSRSELEAVCLVIDISGSMGMSNAGDSITRIDATKRAINGFLGVSQPSRSRVATVAFSDMTRVVFPITNKYSGIIASVDALAPIGGTQISKALMLATDLVTIQPVGVMRLIVLSDGEAFDAEEALAWARSTRPEHVIIDTIFFGEENSYDRSNDYGYISGYQLMFDLAAISGGVFTLARNAKELFKTFKQLEAGARGLLTSGSGAA